MLRVNSATEESQQALSMAKEILRFPFVALRVLAQNDNEKALLVGSTQLSMKEG